MSDSLEAEPFANVAVNARDVLALIGLLGVTLVINNFVEKRQIPIPQAITTIATGAIGGALASLSPSINHTTFQHLEQSSASEFMLVFIAPIIFAEGYGLQRKEFFDNLLRIMVHAFAGTVISTVFVAVCLYYCPPLTGVAKQWQGLTLAECLTFGAMISSTDPVTTLAIFKEQHLAEKGKGHLYYSVLGESILNDAVAITLFGSFGALVQEGQEFTGDMVASLAASFCYKFASSVAIGVVVALLAAFVLKFARLGAGSCEDEHLTFNVPELGVMLVFAYLPFLIAESLDLSGIVAIMFGGITMRAYAHYNLTTTTRQVFLPTVELLANLLETYVFLLLGLGVFLLPKAYSSSVILWAFIGCLAGRACNVYPLAQLANLCPGPRLSCREQHVVWFAGLRGAVAFMCALNFPKPPDGSLEHRHMFLCTTVIIVGATILFLGWPTACVLQCLGIAAPDERHQEFSNANSFSPPERPAGRIGSVLHRSAASVRQLLMTSDALDVHTVSTALPAVSPRPSLGLMQAAAWQQWQWQAQEGQATTAAADGSMPSHAVGAVSGRTSAPPGVGRATGLLQRGAAESDAVLFAGDGGRPSLPARLQAVPQPLQIASRQPTGRRSTRMLVDP